LLIHFPSRSEDWGEERGFDLHNATEKEVEERVRELTSLGEKMVRFLGT
jgi:hypothetical protein